MNKSQLIAAISQHFEGNKKAAQHALESVLDTVTRELVKGEKVAITGFGAFEKAIRPARMVRNPRTGERKHAKKTAVPRFRAGADLKAVVSGEKKLPRSAATTAARATSKRTTSAPAKKSSAKKSPARSAAAKASTAAKKSTAKKSTAKKSPAKKSPAKKSPAKKSAATRPPAKKSAVQNSTVEKATGTKASSTTGSAPTASKRAAKKGRAKPAEPATNSARKAAPTNASKRASSAAVISTRPAGKRPAQTVGTKQVQGWAARELRTVRKTVEAELNQLRTEYEETMITLTDLQQTVNDSSGDDQADAGSKTFEREHEMSLANNRLDLITQLEHALVRIADGSYGRCESCGE
ncbi:MAG: HU family DNA-binding protein, partial [Nocardioidaceae bacterium]|nr:HU family DNA-binding protein [Nocardioidaceae bacterium]